MRSLGRVLASLTVLLLVAFSALHLVEAGHAASEASLKTLPSVPFAPEDGLHSAQSLLAPPIEELYVVGRLGPEDHQDFRVSNADIWAYGDYAYMSTFSCSPQGVRVMNITDPAVPQLAATIPAPSASHVNDVKVTRVSTPFFDGVLLAHSAEACGPGGLSGIRLYDVSNPASPQFLSNFAAGDVHNLYLYALGERAFVLLAIPYGEVFGTGGHPLSDLLIVNVTDPRNPSLEGAWTIGRDAGLAFGSPNFIAPGLPEGSDCTPPTGTPVLCRGNFPAVFLHDVWGSEDGAVAYLSYWDAGLVLVDISDPANPSFLGYGLEPPTFRSDEGNAHNAVPAREGNLVLVADEDFAPGPYGFLRIFDTSDPSNPVQVGAYATENSQLSTANSATIHNIYVVGDVAFLSWYEEGIRVVDFSDPTQPQEIAGFDGSGSFWGVYVLGGPDQLDTEELLVLGSDMSAGFHILGLDRSPPDSTHTLVGEEGDNGYYRSSVTVSVDATDARSGVASISFLARGERWTEYTVPVTFAEDGHHYLVSSATDRAGHRAPETRSVFRIDATAPEVEDLMPRGHLTHSEVLISWSGDDAGSGLVRYEIYVDEEAPLDVVLPGHVQGVPLWPSSISLDLSDGLHEVRVVAFDRAGNMGESNSTFSVDTNLFSPAGPYGGLPLYVLLGGAAVAVAVVSVWIVKRRGRP